jgi:hypothetical protein
MYNYAASLVVGPFTHCELAFRFKNDYQIFMLNIGHKAAILPRRLDYYRSAQWTGYVLLLSADHSKQLWEACNQDVRNELDYDARVHCNLFLPAWMRFSIDTDDASWCAQHVVTRVRQIRPRIFRNLDDNITPAALERYCRSHPRYFRRIQS